VRVRKKSFTQGGGTKGTNWYVQKKEGTLHRFLKEGIKKMPFPKGSRLTRIIRRGISRNNTTGKGKEKRFRGEYEVGGFFGRVAGDLHIEGQEESIGFALRPHQCSPGAERHRGSKRGPQRR